MDVATAERLLADAREALRAHEDTLTCGADAHLSVLRMHNKRTAAMLRSWRPLERDAIVRPALFGRREVLLAPLSQDLLDAEERAIIAHCTQPYALRDALETVWAIAHRQDFDIAGPRDYVSPSGETHSAPVSRKCTEILALMDTLQHPEEAALAYTALHSRVFRGPVQQLPHLAALFHNDCMHMAILLLRDASDAARDSAKRIAAAGRAALGTMQLRLGDDIARTLCDSPGDSRESAPTSPTSPTAVCVGPRGESWSATRYGQLQKDTIARLGVVVGRALARISQAQRVLQPVLEDALLRALRVKLLRIVREWLWSGLMAQPGCVADAALLRSSVVMPVVEACASITDAFGDGMCVETAARVSTMTVIQLGNAYRKGDFASGLLPADLCTLVTAFFPDTAMRRAFIDEVRIDFDDASF